MKFNKNLMLGLFILSIGIIARFIPHIPNFVPITAIALFAGRYFPKYWSLIIPLAAMFLSDLILGFSDVTAYVYVAVVLASFLGYFLKDNFSVTKLGSATLLSSILFFLITNFGVWRAGWYGFSFDGLITCYVMALPFFRNSLLGDILYTAVFFGLYELGSKYLIHYNLAEENH